MLQVFLCNISVSRPELGLTRDRYSRAELRSRLGARTIGAGWQQTAGVYPVQRSLQDLVDDFAAKVATGAVLSLQTWAQNRPSLGLTVGGRSSISRALRYTRHQITPSESDVGAVGEGIAGYYLENIENLVFEIRPFDVSPDLIFRDPAGGSVILCEVKTSIERWPRTLLTDAMNLLDILSKSLFISPRNYVAYLAQVKILSDTEFELRRLKVEVR